MYSCFCAHLYKIWLHFHEGQDFHFLQRQTRQQLGRVPPKSACWFTALVFMGWRRVSWPCDKRQPAAWKRPSRRPPGFPAQMHPKWNHSGGFEVRTNSNESVSRDLWRRIKQTHSVILVSVADPSPSLLPPALQTYLRRARLYWNVWLICHRVKTCLGKVLINLVRFLLSSLNKGSGVGEGSSQAVAGISLH